MADQTTPNLALILGTVGGSIDSWGGKLNFNFTSIDAAVAERLKKSDDALEGQVGLISGSASEPWAAVIGSLETGFYSDAPDTVSVAVNGVNVGAWSGTGYIGVDLGFTGDLGMYVASVRHAKLKAVQTDANNGGFDIFNRIAGTLTAIGRIINGRLGLGRTDPAAVLDVNGPQCWNSTDLASGTAINLSLGNDFFKTITGNTTFTITNAPGARATGFRLELTNGGAYTLTWPASVKWVGGAVPSLTASGVDILAFTTRDGGTTWRGKVTDRNSA